VALKSKIDPGSTSNLKLLQAKQGSAATDAHSDGFPCSAPHAKPIEEAKACQTDRGFPFSAPHAKAIEEAKARHTD